MEFENLITLYRRELNVAGESETSNEVLPEKFEYFQH